MNDNKRLDSQVQRFSHILGLKEPHPRYIQSLQNWLAGNAPLAKAEEEFLLHHRDLASFSTTDDDITPWLERVLSPFSHFFQSVSPLLFLFFLSRCAMHVEI